MLLLVGLGNPNPNNSNNRHNVGFYVIDAINKQLESMNDFYEPHKFVECTDDIIDFNAK